MQISGTISVIVFLVIVISGFSSEIILCQQIIIVTACDISGRPWSIINTEYFFDIFSYGNSVIRAFFRFSNKIRSTDVSGVFQQNVSVC